MKIRQPITSTLILATSLTLLFSCSESPRSHKEADQSTMYSSRHQPIPAEQEVKLSVSDVAASQLLTGAKVQPQAPPVSRAFQEGKKGKMSAAHQMVAFPVGEGIAPPIPAHNTESYTPLEENVFINANNDPLSTFSIDVDTASYANIRRFINSGSLPPVGAIRIEEMVNYFNYEYPQPEDGPFSLTAELGPAPWNSSHKLVKIGLQAKKIDARELPPSNLVFLIDVSGSMNSANKLPLLKQSMLMLVDELTAKDRVSIVVYAGADRIVLQPTAGDKKEEIRAAIHNLTSGGSTHGSSGIITAYALAEQVLMPQGNNRVILASDGDFNVGTTSRGELRKLITEKRETGVFLTVLGFGMGNYHDDTMEILADSGNGNYGYIDSLLEAKKVLIKERASTLFALAKDVKIQVEFNPAIVGAYRLIGYENRMLADEDFKDDKKDAGEIGLGHAVTALYEIIPAGSPDIPEVDELKYRKVQSVSTDSFEIMTLKLRYKPIGLEISQLQTITVHDSANSLSATSDDFRFASSVAGFGMVLKKSPYIHDLDLNELIDIAKNSKGRDEDGYRAEFIRLLEMAQLIKR
ncbi:vWA domain-containing protein [Desulfosediminicola flagellatus]|uniref:vWA domain-containing protein n=1 Tax=Desulfosediminicola flagellatus TaxID=2569541 RepID=UPI001E36BCE7|nr:von Willebrand factor type A domain-containing protein [Desulfosediminicola flagellatus]